MNDFELYGYGFSFISYELNRKMENLNKCLFNLILENLLYEKLRKDKEVNLYIGNNDIEFKVIDNSLIISLNGLSSMCFFEKDNYSDFINAVSNQLEHIIYMYLEECEKEYNWNDNEILEEWQ